MAKRKSTPDLISRFYAEQRRDHYARKGLRLSESGQISEAKKAMKAAEHWQREARKFS
jgi:hypothetical protein